MNHTFANFNGGLKGTFEKPHKNHIFQSVSKIFVISYNFEILSAIGFKSPFTFKNNILWNPTQNILSTHQKM